MVFSSIFFIFFFLPVTLILYYAVNFKYKNIVLLIASLVFYAWGEPVYVLLMILNIAFNYLAGLDLELNRGRAARGRISLIFTVGVNLSLLGFFKYYGFFVTNLNALTGLDIPCKEIGLPIGISFYTFQVLSYIIDVYRGKINAQHSILDLGVYVTMFPQLIAGPIVQYADIENQLGSRKINARRFSEGMTIFITGLGKKVLFANSAGAIFDKLSAIEPNQLTVLGGWLIAISYTFQIYFDFSGYSDMAIGLGRMLGFDFNANFNYPYIAKSATDFWHRWHISLSTWFRDYVYIPLGGSYVNTWRHIRNLLIVWMLTGLWHGAAWNFVLWGLYYGLILIFEKYFFMEFTQKHKVSGIVMHIYTMLIVMVGWVLFSSADMHQCMGVLSAMLGIFNHSFADAASVYCLTSSMILAGFMCCCCTPVVKLACDWFTEKCPGLSRIVMPAAYLAIFVVCIAYLVSETYNPFLYFRF